MERQTLPHQENDCCETVSVCKHCGQSCAHGRDFCCDGCRSAYALSEAVAQDTSPLLSVPDPDASYVFESFVKTNDEGINRLILGVEGVHCAACIQKIESALNREKDVKTGRLNFSTRRLTIEWTGAPERGNELAAVVGRLGYRVAPFDQKTMSEGAVAEERSLLVCLAVAGFAAGNLMMISVGLWASTQDVMGIAMRDFLHWVSAVIALPAIAYAGQPFFRSAFGALKEGHANMDVPISLAILLASGMSLHETITHGEDAYFDSATMLMFFLLIGRYLDFRARRSARSAATDMLAMLSGTATVMEGEGVCVIPIKDVRENMTLQVAVGEKFPADGILLNGPTEVDASLITGESMPELIQKGGSVFAGTLNMAAPVRVRVSKASDDSLLSDIVRLMEKAEQGQAKYVRLADRAARLYTPTVHTLAALSFLGWWLVGGLMWQDSLLIAVTVLIITCPCALGLAVPVVQVLATGRLMRQGILVKSGDALERLAAVDTVLFDKTGTLTLGRPVLDDVQVQTYDDGGMKLAASLAAHSRHPLSKALVAAYEGEVFDMNADEKPGKGVEATYEGRLMRLGSRAWCGDDTASHETGKLELWLSVEGEKPVRFLFSDALRADAREVLSDLKRGGLSLSLLSGDRKQAVQSVAAELGIDDARGALSPVDKFTVLEDLQKRGHKLLMVGDGLNDAPVLAGADVSMSPATALDIAQNTADIVFMGDRLAPVRDAYYVSRKTQTLVKQNFTLAIVYNMIAVPLAVFGLVTPLIAALAMSGSSLLVVANSFRLTLRKGNAR